MSKKTVKCYFLIITNIVRIDKNEKSKIKIFTKVILGRKIVHSHFIGKTGIFCQLYTKLYTLSTEKEEKVAFDYLRFLNKRFVHIR